MNTQRVFTSLQMILRMLLRRRIVLVLLLVIPAVFLSTVYLTTSDRLLPFRLASLQESVFIEVAEKEISLLFFAVASSGFLLAFLGLNLIQKNSEVNRRLVICGYHPVELLMSNLLALFLMTGFIAVYIGLLTNMFFSFEHLYLVILGLALTGLVYGCYGLAVGSLIRGELEGILLILLLIAWGMFALIKYGHGLPMNAYPPDTFVQRGPYRLLQHPIYWGFGLLVAGAAIATGSAGGLWLVTPVTILGMVALVWGYEGIALKQRFPEAESKTLLAVPAADEKPALLRDRLASLFWVFAALFLGNALVKHLAGGAAPMVVWNLDVHPLFSGGPFYLFCLLFVLGVPLALKRQDQLRAWTLSTLLALALAVYLALVWPALGTVVFPADFAPVFSRELLSLTSVFLIWLSLNAYAQRFKQISVLFWVAGIFLTVFQLANSRSAFLEFVVAVTVYLAAVYYLQIWALLRVAAENIANFWKEWTFGPVRVINHGFYVGFGTFLGILLAGALAGVGYAWVLLIFTFIVIVFSAVWAQLIEGSEKLKRPFGYYGALVGVLFAGLIVWGLGYQVWVVIGVVSVVMPWVQAIGRLRCLTNGCCHGSPTANQQLGIRYFHQRSRVCGISGLKGELLHPTPLYAIVWLFFTGFVLLALWQNALPNSFLFGLYLILTGLGRFVEEAYRGEVQTPIWKGLRLYQWTAIASVAVGIVMTVVPVPTVVVYPGMGWEIVVAALCGALFSCFAMGVDFPRSNARFSRLV